MSINKLERVLWRLRRLVGDRVVIKNNELRRCIMYEIGTDPETYRKNRLALKHMGWLVARDNKTVRLTNKDLIG